MSKQAVVYLLDASCSMGSATFGCGKDSDGDDVVGAERRTRFEHAKQGILEMIGDLMLQSKTNECSVIALQTEQTRHHKYRPHQDDDEDQDDDNETQEKDIPFRHLTEYPHQGIRKPTVSLLRQIQAIEPRSSSTALSGGDFCSGIVLAADSLHERTHKKKYDRSIVLWTDARGYNVVMDVHQMLLVIDALRSMECRLYVVGMDFVTQTVNYQMPAPPPPKSNASDEEETGDGPRRKRSKRLTTPHNDDEEDHDSGAGSSDDGHENEQDENDDDDDDKGDENEADEDESNDDHHDPDRLVYKTPEDRERLLQSLTEKTGGTVLAAHTMQQILQHQQGQRKPSVSTAFHLEFHLAPNLVLSGVRFSLWAAKKAVESFKQEAVQIVEADDDGDNDVATERQSQSQKIPPSIHSMSQENGGDGNFCIRTNVYGEEMTEKIHKITSYLDPEDHNTVIPLAETTKAVRYGSDILPMSDFDLEATKAQLPKRPDKPTLQVLGYLPQTQVPQAYRQGPPYRIFAMERGGRNDTALKALAKALTKTHKIAIVTLVKRSGSDPVLGGLFPNNNNYFGLGDGRNDPHPLVFLQLPYAGDVKELPTHVFDKPVPPAASSSFSQLTHFSQLKHFSQLTHNNNNVESGDGVTVARQLIQCLSLQHETTVPLLPANPFHKAWNQTRLARSLNPLVPPPLSSSLFTVLPTPPHVVQRAIPLFDSFRQTFPIIPRHVMDETQKTSTTTSSSQNKNKNNNNNKKKNQALTYTDFL